MSAWAVSLSVPCAARLIGLVIFKHLQSGSLLGLSPSDGRRVSDVVLYPAFRRRVRSPRLCAPHVRGLNISNDTSRARLLARSELMWTSRFSMGRSVCGYSTAAMALVYYPESVSGARTDSGNRRVIMLPETILAVCRVAAPGGARILNTGAVVIDPGALTVPGMPGGPYEFLEEKPDAFQMQKNN
ncbi:hypothetical protein B0H11DRAFT_1924713 [Mycena galericulata]|nr:hypothetical protein B0H11DRAFT_1924713 [Mycena galericulata]